MNKKYKTLKISSDYYTEKMIQSSENNRIMLDLVTFFLEQIENRYLDKNQLEFRKKIDILINNNHKDKIIWGLVSNFFEIEESDRENQSLEKIIKKEIKYNINNTILNPHLSPKKTFFILINSTEVYIEKILKDISNQINSITPFSIEIIRKPIQKQKKNNVGAISMPIEKEKFYNKILFGPTGTGKSNACTNFIKENNIKDCDVFRTMFYEDYSYHDFFGQYKPIVLKTSTMIQVIAECYENKNGNTVANQNINKPEITYQFVPGIFFKAYLKAIENKDKNVILIIEEINRGNCSSIFGDIFQLLDRDENGKSKYNLSLTYDIKKYIIDIIQEYKNNMHFSKNREEYDSDIEVFQNILKENSLYIPSNMLILATMNTSDQSLFPIDSAFKRRWDLEYIKINYKEESLKDVIIENTNYIWLETLKKINDIILKETSSEDKQIGQWFIKAKNKVIKEKDFKNKVISYLFFDVFKHMPQVFQSKAYSEIINMDIKEILDIIIIKESN